MEKQLKLVLYFAIISIVISKIMLAQDVRSTLFAEVNKLLEEAKTLNSQLLSPSNYADGMEYYNDAESALNSGDNINDVREDVERAHEYLKKANDIAKMAKDTFADLIKSRVDAKTANAHLSAPDLWEYGVESFTSAAEEFEAGYAQDAQEIARESEKYFRDAELKAIKQKLLGPTKELLNQAEDLSVIDFAPVTLSKSKLLIQQAESELNDIRYNNTHAEEIIKEAFYEAKHSIYMTKLFQEMIDKEKSWEDIKLASEEPLKEIAEKYNLPAKFDAGYDATKNSIIAYVAEFNVSIEKLRAEIDSLQNDKDELKAQLDDYSVQIDAVNAEKKVLEEKLASIQLEKDEFNNVTALFSMSEAEVLKDGYNIVIRLHSLNFDAGKSVIDPQFFSLLSKVQKAIVLFQNCTVSVEGNTDSQGAEDTNLSLSQERADAVRQYLLANLEVDSNRVLAIGYGETKPIANNETEEGRRKNRRIDVVINPNNSE